RSSVGAHGRRARILRLLTVQIGGRLFFLRLRHRGLRLVLAVLLRRFCGGVGGSRTGIRRGRRLHIGVGRGGVGCCSRRGIGGAVLRKCGIRRHQGKRGCAGEGNGFPIHGVSPGWLAPEAKNAAPAAPWKRLKSSKVPRAQASANGLVRSHWKKVSKYPFWTCP